MIEWFRIQIESWIESRRQEKIRRNTCESCENLKNELALAHRLHEMVFNKLTEKPEKEVERPLSNVTRPTSVRIPWSVKRQELEREDRIQADKLKREKIEELEKEVTQGKVENAL